MQTITTPKYVAKIDKNGGATYEFYNRRARLNGNPSTEFLANAIHPDVGAALQIAIHDRRGTPIQSPCADATNPYVNPTQAGSFCNTNNIYGSSPVKTSTGVSFPGLVGSVLDTPWFNVLNWNYSTLASSPQNDRIRGPLTNPPLVSPATPQTDPGSTFALVDNFQMKQTVTANNNYLKYDVTVKPLGKENVTLTAGQNPNPGENPVPTNLRPGVTFEAPTFYFATGYRKHTVRRNGVIVTTTVPSRRTATALTHAQLGMGQAPLDIQLGINDGWNHEDIPWVTFENTDNRTNDVYTIAAFFKPKFRCDVQMIWNQRNFAWTVAETTMFRMIKFTKAPIMNMRYDEQYQFQYVVFPYAWWETPDGATQTVEQLIQSMRTAYETGTGTPNCAPI